MFWVQKITTCVVLFLAVLFYLPDYQGSSPTSINKPETSSQSIAFQQPQPKQPPAAYVSRQPATNTPAENVSKQPVQVPPAKGENAIPDASSESVKTVPPTSQAMALEPNTVNPQQLIKRVENISHQIALTFDDGPFPEMTEQYLAVLQKYNARATFFMIGQQVVSHPEQAKKVISQGSEIGSHSWQHARLDKLKPDAVVTDLSRVGQQVYETLGQDITLVRPPYGGYSETVLTKAQELNQQVVMWDVDPRDWEDPSPEVIAARVLDKIKPGSIVVLHEGRKNTLQALPIILEKLQEQGLEVVPVSEMLTGESEPAPPPAETADAPHPNDPQHPNN